jgi:ATP-binding cassette, subfamily B, bacterial
MADLRRRLGTLLSMTYRADPRRCVVFFASSCVDSSLPLLGGLLVKLIIDAARHGEATAIVGYGVVLGVVAPVPAVVKNVRNRAAFVLIEKSTERYDRALMRLSAQIPGVAHLEDPEYLDRLEQLRHQPQALGQNGSQVSVLLWGCVQAALLVTLLVSVHPVLLALPLAAAPSLWAVRRAQRSVQQAFARGAGARRLANHCFELATSPARADETRTLRIGAELRRRHRAAWSDADRAMVQIERRAAASTTAARLVFVAGYTGAVAFVVDRGIRGQATAGDLVLTVVLASLVNQQLVNVLDAGGRLAGALALVDRFLWLVDHAEAQRPTPTTTTTPSRLEHGITFEHVRFRYPGADADVFRDLDLHLPAGAVVAVVGDNGVGKTTLVKLLTRMYEPTAGSIRIDGIPLDDLDVITWRERITAAFQDHARFEATLRESVGCGQLDAIDDGPSVRAALGRAGAARLPDTLPDGLATPLGASLEDGVQLSGGRWQQVALGRAMMRAAPLILVLDEPAASLDPVAEAELFRRYAARARQTGHAHGAITLLVSHRFATVRMADLIVVLDRGGVRESGTHAALMAAGGSYAELYELQAATYR